MNPTRRVCRNARGVPNPEGQVRSLGRVLAEVAQLAEARRPNRRQCGFESHPRHCRASVLDSTRSFYLRGPGSTPGRGPMNEKEKVYTELDALRKRVFNLRQQVRSLQLALSEPEIRRLRAEHTRMRKALSMIAYAPSENYEDVNEIRAAAGAALVPTATGSKAAQRQFARAKRTLIRQQVDQRRAPLASRDSQQGENA